MHVFNLRAEQAFDPKKHMERVLGRIDEGDVTVACWEPGQTSPYHCHPNATEIYLCFEGGGGMRTPTETIEIGSDRGPSSFIREASCTNTSTARNAPSCSACATARKCPVRTKEWPSNPDWTPRPQDIAYFGRNPGA